MSHNKLVKTLTDSANLAGLAVGIGWVAKKSYQETDDFLSDFKSHELFEVHCRDRCISRNKKYLEELKILPSLKCC